MGYYTRFELTVVKEDEENAVWGIDYKKEIEQISDDSPFIESCKWYDHEEDMKKLSKKFPKVIFLLHGEGEETGDLWNKYFTEGKMQVCKAEIIYPPMNMKLFE